MYGQCRRTCSLSAGPCPQLNRGRPDQVLVCACMRGLVWSGSSQAEAGRIPRRELGVWGSSVLWGKLCVDLGPHRAIVRDWRKSVVLLANEGER